MKPVNAPYFHGGGGAIFRRCNSGAHQFARIAERGALMRPIGIPRSSIYTTPSSCFYHTAWEKAGGWCRQRFLGFHEPERTLRTSRESPVSVWRNTTMNRRFIRRTAGGSRMRYARRRMKRREQESGKEDGSPMKSVSGPNGSERFVTGPSAGQEFVPLREIALVRKETRKHPPGGDVL